MKQPRTNLLLEGECCMLTCSCLPAPMATSASSVLQLFCRVAPHRSISPPPHFPPPHSPLDRYVRMPAVFRPTWLTLSNVLYLPCAGFTPRAKVLYTMQTLLPQQVDSISSRLGGHAVRRDLQTVMSRYVLLHLHMPPPQRLQFLNNGRRRDIVPGC